jgi:histidine triad (HIT) family protein
MADCIFCKIVKKEIPAGIVYEDDKVLAFNDITPQAATHILVIPKVHIAQLSEVKDYSLLAALFKVINQIARERELDKSGFRVVINNGRSAGMAVDHLHTHLLAGRNFHWPPG